MGEVESGSGQGCYAVKVRSRAEATVSHALRLKGYEVLMPTYIEQRPYSDRVKKVVCSLFPGYIFVRLDARELLPVVSTDGVSYIVKSGGTLTPLPHDEVAAIESLCFMKRGCEPCEHLVVGQRVLIESGPLAGQQGRLVRIADNDRVIISINSIFSSVSIDVSDTIVKVVD